MNSPTTVFLVEIARAGLEAVWEYIGLHVLTCLVPAFLLAGAMVSFINKEAIIASLGAGSSKPASFAMATGASFFVAACSCTVIPVASGIYFSGAGIGAAFILLWVAPASNLLSLIYTGNILGAEMIWARVLTAVAMAAVIGTVMAFVFRREESERLGAEEKRGQAVIIGRKDLVLLGLLVLSLLAPNYLVQEGPYSLKVAVWLVATGIAAAYALYTKTSSELRGWLEETWWFIRLIFPLLLLGVFVVGIIGAVLPRSWIEQYLGGSSLSATFFATLLGSVSYFATLTEAPFVHTLIGMGMGKGPALALLLTGPGLSLPNWLVIGRVFGIKKAIVYVSTVIVLGTVSGWFVGTFLLS